MADKLYPLVMKPGIKRDGTKFQGEYCTEGQWIRFQRGTARKMGGLQAVNIALIAAETPNILYMQQQSNATVWAYVGNGSEVTCFKFNNPLTLNGEPQLIVNAVDLQNDKALWQMISIIQTVTTVVENIPTTTKESFVILFGCNNLKNIENTDAASIYVIPAFITSGALPFDKGAAKLDLTSGDYSPNTPYIHTGIGTVNGGMCYAAPYLFLYGSDGQVKISNSINNFNFNQNTQVPANGALPPLTICNDKIIYGTQIRGANVLTLLFWSLSSVIRITNINTGEGLPNFQITVLTQNSSILSSRCVLEYDGLFFWPGTNRFFTYNGSIQEMINTMSLNYFFDNIDMAKRQFVFGIVKAQYGELWWFYPEKINSGNPNIGCTKVLIYNIRENSWYDTVYSADSGVALNSNGGVYTISPSITQPPGSLYLFQHEMANPNEVIPSIIDNKTFTRETINNGVASSNAGINGIDGKGGGIAANCFDGDISTACYQTVLNGNISYSYINGINIPEILQEIITCIGIRAAIKTKYNIVVEASNDLDNPWTAIGNFLNNQLYNPNTIIWLIIDNNVPYSYYRIRETTQFNSRALAITEIYFDSAPNPNNLLNTPISSYFTTPIFSFSSFSPLKEMDGINRWLILKGIEPDFVISMPGSEMIIQVNTKQFAQDVFETTRIPGPLAVPSDATSPSPIIGGVGGTDKVDFYIQGRQMSLTISSLAFFELGHLLLKISIGDGR